MYRNVGGWMSRLSCLRESWGWSIKGRCSMARPPRRPDPMARSSKSLWSKRRQEYWYVALILRKFLFVMEHISWVVCEKFFWFDWQGNLGWAYMQQRNYQAAEAVYRKAQTIDPDANKACNLTLCLIKQARFDEASKALDDIFQGKLAGADDPKSRSRAEELLREIESLRPPIVSHPEKLDVDESIIQRLDMIMNEWTPFRSRRLPIFEEISPFRDQIACWSWTVLLPWSCLLVFSCGFRENWQPGHDK